jgi:sugar/nucleoside kinase (ribokinase family)
MQLAVAGHANLDVQLQVKELPKPGASVPVLERRTVWGGTAANIARHAGGLGVPVRLWSRVGADFPPAWRDALQADGVDLTFLDVAENALTPTCFILTDLVDRQSYVMDEGPMGRMDEHPVGVEFLNGLDEDSWLHVGTGNPIGYAPVVHAARSAGLNVAFDPGQELRFQYDTHSFEGLLDQSRAFFCNEFELKVACDYLRYAAPEQFLDHVEMVVVTRGEKGASLYRAKKKTLHVPALPAKVVDPTGAGDALRAGWYAALHAGHDFETALRWGVAAASVKIQYVGGQDHVVRRAELDALLKG